MTGATGLAAFIVLVVGTGFTIGYLNVPGSWYASLNKPWFNPSNWIFAPVWAVIYVLIAIAGWRTWEFDRHGTAIRLWLLQMALNFLWPPTFFSAQLPGAALAIILSLFAAILAFIVQQATRRLRLRLCARLPDFPPSMGHARPTLRRGSNSPRQPSKAVI